MIPPSIPEALALLAACIALAGVAQAGIADLLLRRFLARRDDAATVPDGGDAAPVTLLKPLHGDEALLEEALATFCAQDYPRLQIVFGVQNKDDPAIAIVDRLRDRFPGLDVALVVDQTPHGPNRKVDNLINMLPHAKHAWLLISDADIHAPADLVRSVMAPFADRRIGLSTTLYTGRPASGSVARLLGAAGINQSFLPGALLGRAMGREDCLGAVMALSTETLAAIGGLRALSPHLADDAVLGAKVRALGLGVALARAVPATSVVEGSFAELFRHELRWGRTVRGQAPIGYPLSAVQAPIAWALLACLAAGGAPWSLALLAGVWAGRAAVGADLERLLCGRRLSPLSLAPLRDVLSLVVIVASHLGGRVAWRGQTLHISADKNLRLEQRAHRARRPVIGGPRSAE